MAYASVPYEQKYKVYILVFSSKTQLVLEESSLEKQIDLAIDGYGQSLKYGCTGSLLADICNGND